MRALINQMTCRERNERTCSNYCFLLFCGVGYSIDKYVIKLIYCHLALCNIYLLALISYTYVSCFILASLLLIIRFYLHRTTRLRNQVDRYLV
jgi:hypothetical protein